MWGLAQLRRSHSHHRFEGTLPGGLARALKAFCLAEPLMLELHRWLPQDGLLAGEGAHPYPAGAVPPAPKGFALGSEDVTAATTGESCWR